MRYFLCSFFKFAAFSLVLLSSSGCSLKETKATKIPVAVNTTSVTSPPSIEPSTSQICFLMIDIESGQIFNSLNEEFCSLQVPAANTFNLPLYLMVLEEQLNLPKGTNLNLLLKNDAKDKSLMTQQLISKLSFEKLRHYLRNFEYGNQDLSGGYEKVGTPSESELKISGFEQSAFLRNLARNKFSVKPANGQLAISKLSSLKDKKNHALKGKTSYFTITKAAEENSTQELSWYIGYLKKGSKHYTLATIILKDSPQEASENKKAPLQNEAFLFTINKLQEINSWFPAN